MIEQIELPQHAVGHAQRISHRSGAAWHGNVGEVGEALEIGAVGDEALPTPDGAVDAVTRPVEREAAYRADRPCSPMTDAM